MRKFFFIIFLFQSSFAFSQNWPVKQAVADRLNAGADFKKIPAFSFSASRTITGRGTYSELQLRPDFISTIMEQKPASLQVDIPLNNRQTITCQLVKASLGNVKITENNGKIIPGLSIPVLYRGIVEGEQQKNNVVLTVTESSVSLLATFTDKTIQLVQADTLKPLVYRLYHSQQVQFPVTEFDCGTKPLVVGNSAVPLDGSVSSRTGSVQDKCVNVYVDCFDSLYQHFGSSRQQTLNYVYQLFNLVATGFANDSVNVQLTGVNVWTSADPYRQTSREIALKDLCFYQKDNFWGNVCVGLDWGTRGHSGIASKIGIAKSTPINACAVSDASDSTGACCYCDMNYSVSVQNFPTGSSTTQQQVYLTMHEMGHLFGAHHTKWCGWLLSTNPNVYGTLDSCDVIEGNCAQGPPPPATGATIMSYCVTGNGPNQFVNYNNGFGPLPGNAIRSYIANNACIANCMLCSTNRGFYAPPNGDAAAVIPFRLKGDKQHRSRLPDTPE